MKKLHKRILCLLTFLFVNILFSQVGSLEGKILDRENNQGFPGVILILKDSENKTFGTQTDIEGKYKFENLSAGVYTLKISSIGIRDKIIENFVIEPKPKEFNQIFPEPCAEVSKICPKNHSDKIIPIVYGLPSKKMQTKSKKGKIKLGGCDPSYCEKWYCKTHDLNF